MENLETGHGSRIQTGQLLHFYSPNAVLAKIEEMAGRFRGKATTALMD